MKINTFGEFYTFIINNNLINLHPDITDFTVCVHKYNSTCTCKKQTKNAIGEQCTKSYISLVNNVLPLIKSQIFEKIPDDSLTFCYNYHFTIGSISRQ